MARTSRKPKGVELCKLCSGVTFPAGTLLHRGDEYVNMENGNVEIRQNGGLGVPSSSLTREDDKCLTAETGVAIETTTQLVPCAVTDGLTVGMEVCTYDSLGMGLECDEDILTTSSLDYQHIKAERVGEGEGERDATSEDQSRDTDPNKCQLTNSTSTSLPALPQLPKHTGLCCDLLSTDDTSTLDSLSQQGAQSDNTYCASQLSSSQGDMTYSSLDDTGTVTTTSDGEGGGARGGACAIRPKCGRRRVGRGRRERMGRNRDRRRVRHGVRTGSVNGVQTQTIRKKGRRRPELERLIADSSDSSETTGEDNSSLKLGRKRSGKHSTLLLPPKSSRTLPPKRPKFTTQEPPENILGAILTDIPEVDIRPQTLPKIANHIHREVDTRGEEGERERGRVEGGEREGVKEGVSGRGNSTPQDKTMSNHYRILMSWERDYPLGLRATRAPVLYALDNIPEKVKAVKGGWINRAKLIWTTWRRASIAERDEYCERAKLNRSSQKGKTSASRRRRNNSKPSPQRSPGVGTTCDKVRPDGATAVVPTPPQLKTEHARSPASSTIHNDTGPNSTTTPHSTHSRTKKTKQVKNRTKRVAVAPPNRSPTTPNQASRETCGSVEASSLSIVSPLSLPPATTSSSLSSPVGLHFYRSLDLPSPQPPSPYFSGLPASLISPLPSSPFKTHPSSDPHNSQTPSSHIATAATSSATPSSVSRAASPVKRKGSRKQQRRASISVIPCSVETQAREMALKETRLKNTPSSSDCKKDEPLGSCPEMAVISLPVKRSVESVTSTTATAGSLSVSSQSWVRGSTRCAHTPPTSLVSASSLNSQPFTPSLDSKLSQTTPTSLSDHTHPYRFPWLPTVTTNCVVTSTPSHNTRVSLSAEKPSLSHSHAPSMFPSREHRVNSKSSAHKKHNKCSQPRRSRSRSTGAVGVACLKFPWKHKSTVSASLPSPFPSPVSLSPPTSSSPSSSSSKLLTSLKRREISAELLPYLVRSSLSSGHPLTSPKPPPSLHSRLTTSAATPNNVLVSPSLSLPTAHPMHSGSQLHISSPSLSPMVASSPQLALLSTAHFSDDRSLQNVMMPSSGVSTPRGQLSMYASVNNSDIGCRSLSLSNGTTGTEITPWSVSPSQMRPNHSNTANLSEMKPNHANTASTRQVIPNRANTASPSKMGPNHANTSHDIGWDGTAEAERLTVDEPRVLSKLTNSSTGDGLNIYKQINVGLSGIVPTRTARRERKMPNDRERAKRCGTSSTESRSKTRRPSSSSDSLLKPTSLSAQGGAMTFGPGSIIPSSLDTLIPQLPTDLLLGNGPSNDGKLTGAVERRRKTDSDDQIRRLLSTPDSAYTPTTSGSRTKWAGPIPPGVYSTPPLALATSHTPSRPLPSSYAPLSMLTPLPLNNAGGYLDNAACGNKIKKETLNSPELQSSSLTPSRSSSSLLTMTSSIQAMTSSGARVEKFNNSATATRNAATHTRASDKKSKTPTDKTKRLSPRLLLNAKKRLSRSKTRKSGRGDGEGVMERESGKKSIVGVSDCPSGSSTHTQPGQISNGFLAPPPSLPHPLTMFSPSLSTPHTSIPHTPIPHTPIPFLLPFGTMGHLKLGQPVFPPGQPNIPFDHPSIISGLPLGIPGLSSMLSGPFTPPHPPLTPAPFSQNVSLWELEQLHQQSLAVLEQQKHYVTFLETEIQRMRESADLGNNLSKEQQREIYNHFLSCVDEPDFEIHVPLFPSPSLGSSSPSETKCPVPRIPF